MIFKFKINSLGLSEQNRLDPDRIEPLSLNLKEASEFRPISFKHFSTKEKMTSLETIHPHQTLSSPLRIESFGAIKIF